RRIHPRDTQDNRAGPGPAPGPREVLVPRLEVNRLGHDGDPACRHAVLAPRDVGTVLTGPHDGVCATRVEAFPPRLDPEQHPNASALVLELVRDDAFEARDERHPPGSPPEEPPRG